MPKVLLDLPVEILTQLDEAVLTFNNRVSKAANPTDVVLSPAQLKEAERRGKEMAGDVVRNTNRIMQQMRDEITAQDKIKSTVQKRNLRMSRSRYLETVLADHIATHSLDGLLERMKQFTGFKEAEAPKEKPTKQATKVVNGVRVNF